MDYSEIEKVVFSRLSRHLKFESLNSIAGLQLKSAIMDTIQFRLQLLSKVKELTPSDITAILDEVLPEIVNNNDEMSNDSGWRLVPTDPRRCDNYREGNKYVKSIEDSVVLTLQRHPNSLIWYFRMYENGSLVKYLVIRADREASALKAADSICKEHFLRMKSYVERVLTSLNTSNK